MKKCSICDYSRQPNDDIHISPLECPKCGIIYKKRGDHPSRKKAAKEAERMAQGQAKSDLEQESPKDSEHKCRIEHFMNKLSRKGLFKPLRQNDTLCKVFSNIKDSKPMQWVIKYKDSMPLLLL